ncbi:hypothetical protein Vretimale_12141 [Volvox reticuliferus]|uniref:Uncharacterized protein n=1 Tax=Volvox reticuliferus TaxID=1737510 RepID=A0A8J4LS69_9CHLO|nr:hypothetical protein Vretifemale_9604 [Volvox reticuliferus]GIM08048.1 hypothetical protein Vretimale_12141 [Volvox reticuliferus]
MAISSNALRPEAHQDTLATLIILLQQQQQQNLRLLEQHQERMVAIEQMVARRLSKSEEEAIATANNLQHLNLTMKENLGLARRLLRGQLSAEQPRGLIRVVVQRVLSLVCLALLCAAIHTARWQDAIRICSMQNGPAVRAPDSPAAVVDRLVQCFFQELGFHEVGVLLILAMLSCWTFIGC